MNPEWQGDESGEGIEAWIDPRFNGTAGPLERRSIELEEQLVRERTSAVELEAERDAREHELQRERARAAQLEAREMELEAELRSRGIDLARLKVGHDALVAEHALLREQVPGLRRDAARTSGLERELESERLRLASLRSQGHRLEKQIDALADERDRLRAEVRSLRDFMTQANEQIRSLEARMAALRRESTSARDVTSRTLQELVRTQAQLAARTGELQALQLSGVFRALRVLWRFRFGAVLVVAAVFVAVAIAAGLGPTVTIAGLVGATLSTGLGLTLIQRRRTTGPHTGPRAGTRSRIVELEPPGIAAEEAVPAAAQVPARRNPAEVVHVPEVKVDLEYGRALRARERTIALSTLRVASVLDEMSAACFSPDCELMPVPSGTDARRSAFAEKPPDLLFVESAWAGNSGGWQYRVASYGHPEYAGLPQLKELLGYCRKSGIPTVFWNKEDPVHFDRFKEAAVLFDVILTTDENCVARYQALEGVDPSHVHPLPFAAQPRLHNPIAVIDERSPKPCFAGTYYRTRHEGRRAALDVVLDAARPLGLVIYDRMHGCDDDSYAFPERFLPHVAGRLEYDQTVRAYKSHRVFLNANSVIDSGTMCSRRVFELLACETAVLSTPALAMTTMFEDTVMTGATIEEAREHLSRLLDDEDYRLEVVRQGRRLVFRDHSYRQRLEAIAQAAGVPTSPAVAAACAIVTLIEPETSHVEVGRLATSIRRQADRPAEILVGVAEGAAVDLDPAALGLDEVSQRVRVVRQDAADGASARFRELAAIATVPWIAPFGPGVAYGPNYLTDLAQATVYADADAVGVAGPADAGAVQRYVRDLDPRSAMVRRDHVIQRGWPGHQTGASLERWFREGAHLYAADVPDFTPDADL